jgi:hypothetical protein
MDSRPGVVESQSNSVEIDKKKLQKMLFLFNALEEGWKIKKDADTYIFTKKHENKREIFKEDYLEKFLVSNLSTKILNP